MLLDRPAFLMQQEMSIFPSGLPVPSTFLLALAIYSERVSGHRPTVEWALGIDNYRSLHNTGVRRHAGDGREVRNPKVRSPKIRQLGQVSRHRAAFPV